MRSFLPWLLGGLFLLPAKGLADDSVVGYVPKKKSAPVTGVVKGVVSGEDGKGNPRVVKGEGTPIPEKPYDLSDLPKSPLAELLRADLSLERPAEKWGYDFSPRPGDRWKDWKPGFKHDGTLRWDSKKQKKPDQKNIFKILDHTLTYGPAQNYDGYFFTGLHAVNQAAMEIEDQVDRFTRREWLLDKVGIFSGDSRKNGSSGGSSSPGGFFSQLFSGWKGGVHLSGHADGSYEAEVYLKR
jgi:hypothetical protein